MALASFLASDLGAIILRNVHATLHSSLLSKEDKLLVMLGLRRAARALRLPYRPTDLVDILRAKLQPRLEKLQVAGLSEPAPDTFLIAFRGWPDVLDMLKQYHKVYKDDRELAALVKNPLHTDRFFQRAAEAINKYARTNVPVRLSGAFNIVFMTSTARFDRIVPDYHSLSGAARAKRVRDVLGLVQVAPLKDKPPPALFAFRTLVPASVLMSGARIARPTTVDGFDNSRFKQFWEHAELEPDGGGMTVCMARPFSPGSSEFVATAMLLKDQLTCEYVGTVTEPTTGTDPEFLDYMQKSHGHDLHTLPAGLDAWRPA